LHHLQNEAKILRLFNKTGAGIRARAKAAEVASIPAKSSTADPTDWQWSHQAKASAACAKN
jgi:hypothetical protein